MRNVRPANILQALVHLAVLIVLQALIVMLLRLLAVLVQREDIRILLLLCVCRVRLESMH